MQQRKRSDDKPGTGNTSSQFRGVSFNTHSQKWKAVITVGRKQYFLGYFSNEIEAARAYDKASLELRGSDAPTNFKYDKATIEAAIKAASANKGHGELAGAEMIEEDDMEVEGAHCPSLERLEGFQTNDSMESVRDVEVEVNAVRATLMMRQNAIMNAHAQRNATYQEDVPSEFLCL